MYEAVHRPSSLPSSTHNVRRYNVVLHIKIDYLDFGIMNQSQVQYEPGEYEDGMKMKGWREDKFVVIIY